MEEDFPAYVNEEKNEELITGSSSDSKFVLVLEQRSMSDFPGG